MKSTNWFVLVCYLLMIACSDDSSSIASSPEDSPVETKPDRTYADFVSVKSKGKEVNLGTNDSKARASERPLMTVKFDYDFSIASHETTCGEFRSLMGDRVKDLPCDEDSLPVANVTFFDAVLYANEMSKTYELDTAYTYRSLVLDEDGHCVSMEGFRLNPAINSFRLPTEAEWVLTAGLDWNPKDAWNKNNAKMTAHRICSTPKASAVCDMAGNVMEWVNDWMGPFKDTTISNFGGAPDGGSLGERILKGGSFRISPESMKLYSRGDVYTVTSSTRANYVGFRLALGSIPDMSLIGRDGGIIEGRVSLLANGSAIQTMIGKSKMKLAFRNDVSGNLVFVRYFAGDVVMTEIRDTLDVYHPEISPDGGRVAFSSKYEGVGGTSQLYVRNLDKNGSGLVKLDVESAAIPRWRVTANGDTVIVYVDDSGNNKNDGDFLDKHTWQVKFSGGKFGKPEKLFAGNYHGGVNSDGSLAVTGARLLRARVSGKEKLWYDGEQACNVSLSNDGHSRTLFLDFGGKKGHDFVGEDYKTHGRLLLADSVGKLIGSVASPEGYTFDHSEWALGNVQKKDAEERFAVTSLTNVNGAHEKIALIDVESGDVLELVEGDELWHPSFWKSYDFQQDGDVNLDSAGVYYSPLKPSAFESSSIELGIKMSRFWTSYENLEYVAFGSSMTLNSIDEKNIKTYKALNMAFTLGDIHCFAYLLKHYVYPYAKKLKVVSLELTPGFMYRERDDFWKELYEKSPGFVYDEIHPEQFKTVSSLAQDAIYPEDGFVSEYIDDNFLLPSRSWLNYDVLVDTTSMSMDNENVQANLSILQDLKNIADSLGVKLFMNVTPRNPKYAKTGSFGIYGPSRTVTATMMDTIRGMDISIFDENKDGLHDYTDEMAYNAVHLSYLGAKQYTERLDKFLKDLDEK